MARRATVRRQLWRMIILAAGAALLILTFRTSVATQLATAASEWISGLLLRR